MKTKPSVPEEVIAISKALAEAGFEAYLVGGCVRDMMLGREPKDWDVATDAQPEEIQKLFPESVYENDFGTVGIKTESEDERLKIIQVTTYRIEGTYTDKRHPDEVKFAADIEKDLSRRDFTVNAMAMDMKGDVIDPFGGEHDLKDGVVRTVGAPEERFSEDALRLMRAVRFSAELDFEIEMNTRRAIVKFAGGLEAIAKERVRDELVKIVMTPNAAKGIILLEELDLLRYVLPELREGIGVGQNKHHIYTVFEHNVRALDYTARENYSLAVRMAALLHDVGKPKVKGGNGPDSTFYQHEYVGAKMAVRMLDRLRFPREFTEQVAHLVRSHMFYYDTGAISPAGVRRFVVRVGPENIDDLLKVREADRIGSGVKKAMPYRLRHLLFMIDKVKRDPLSPKMLALRGDDLMPLLDLPQSPRVGWILNALMEEVIDDPKKNDKKYLTKRAKELNTLSDVELRELFAQAQARKREAEEEMDNEIKKQHHVQ
ncbi:MAG TPA: HD domain-containing protein [Candidatus Paceibacterota bacterium]|nr:HD domain-containing protein [Candidatus Paceibacterota bacterium]